MANIFSGVRCYLLEKYSKLDKAPESGTLNMDSILSKYRIAVEKAVRNSQFQESPLSGDAQAVMEAGGKRLRPILVLMSAKLFQVNIPQRSPRHLHMSSPTRHL